MDLGRRQPGRRDLGLRSAGRPLHRPARGRRRDPADRGDGLRRPAALQPGRRAGGLRVGPGRGGEPVADRRRDEGGAAGDRHLRPQLRVAGLAAGRRLRGRGGRGGRARGRRPAQPEALDVARRRRHGGAAHRGAGVAAHHGARAGPRRAPHLVRAAGAAVAVQRHPAAVSARRLRPGDGGAVHADVALRLGVPPDDLARRGVAGLRHPARGWDRVAAARPRIRRRAVAGVSRPAGRPGIGGGGRRAARHVVHARLVRGRRLLWGPHLARADRRRGRAHPGAVPRADGTPDRTGAGLPVPRRRQPHVHGPADP